jgi:hypothetical protein
MHVELDNCTDELNSLKTLHTSDELIKLAFQIQCCRREVQDLVTQIEKNQRKIKRIRHQIEEIQDLGEIDGSDLISTLEFRLAGEAELNTRLTQKVAKYASRPVASAIDALMQDLRDAEAREHATEQNYVELVLHQQREIAELRLSSDRRSERFSAKYRRLVVGVFKKRIQEKPFLRLFKQFGHVEAFRLITKGFQPVLYFGHVQFQRPEDATAARESLDRSIFLGQRIRVKWASVQAKGNFAEDDGRDSIQSQLP